MSELGMVSVLLLTGMVMGVGSVFLSMWFLPALLRRLDVVPAVRQAADKAIAGQQNSRQRAGQEVVGLGITGQPTAGVEIAELQIIGQTADNNPALNRRTTDNLPGEIQNKDNLTVAGKLTPDRAAVGRDVINEEIMAAIAATLCAYGIAENESYRIKQVRVVN